MIESRHNEQIEKLENDHIGTERVTELETKLKEMQEELEKCVNKLFNSDEENEGPRPLGPHGGYRWVWDDPRITPGPAHLRNSDSIQI